MIAYILLAFIIGISAWIEDGKRTTTTIKLFYVGLLAFLIIVGFRYWHGDYGTYEAAYNDRKDVGGDVGYFQLQLLFKNIGLSFQSFVFIITLISVYAFNQIARISKWPSFVLVVILGKIFTLYAMSGIRQYIAMALCWWAVSELLLYKRKILFYAMVVFAATLHGSALIILPVYFFRNMKFTLSNVLTILLLSFVVGAYSVRFFQTAVIMSDFVDDRLGSYVLSREGQGMNLINYLENFLFLFLALIVRKKAVSKIPFYDFFLYMFVIYCGFLLAGKDIGIIKRLRDYYVIAYAFIIPSFIYLFKEQYRSLCHLVVVLYFVFLLFRSLSVYDNPFPEGYYGRMVPYHSILDMK